MHVMPLCKMHENTGKCKSRPVFETASSKKLY